MAVGTRKCLPRLNRVLRAVSVTISWTLIRSELMELHPYYSVLQTRPHLETACLRHGRGNPRVLAGPQIGTIYFTQLRSEWMELHPYYSVPQKWPHLETAGPRHGCGNPRVPAVAQYGSAGTVRANLVPSNPSRIDGATSILLYSAKAASFGNCMSVAWPWEPAGACRGLIGFCGQCL